jgi:O-antigen ligase
MLERIEKIFTIAMLFYATTAILPFILGDTGDAAQGDGDPIAFTIQAALYLLAFCFIALHWRTVIRGAWNAKWILLLILVAVASTGWSQQPLFTLRRSAVMAATTAFGIYFGSRYTVPEQLHLLGWTCALTVFTSFFMALFLPQYGVDHFLFPGAWRGAFWHKNLLARNMVLSVLVFHFLRKSVPNWIRWLGIGVSLCLLALSRSVTGPLVLAAIILVVLMTKLLRQRFTFSIPILIASSLIATCAAFVLAGAMGDVLGFLGRNSTLTGRTYVWKAVLHSIAKHPWLGYGFDAFWTNLPGGSSSLIQEMGWAPGHAHNGFLALTLEMGIVGLGILLAGYLVLWRRALSLTRKGMGVVPIWLCAYLSFMLFYNLDEGPILAQNNIFWILYTSTAVAVSLYASAPFSSQVVNLGRPEKA